MKYCSGRFTCLISFLFLLAGAGIVVLGAIAMGILKTPEVLIEESYISTLNAGQQIGLGVIFLGVFTFLTGICGCCSARTMRPIYTVPFIIFCFIGGICLFAFGITMSGIGGYINDAVQFGCNTTLGEVSLNYGKTIEHYTCSKICPCPKGPNNDWENYWMGLNDDVFKTINRVKSIDYMDKDEKTRYRYYGDSAPKTPLVFADGDDTYNSFIDCYNRKLKDEMKAYPADYVELKNFMDSNYFQIFTYFEA
jgi:hypothetical protein